MPAKLTEDMVIARTKTSDLNTVKKFNCWGSELSDVSVIRRFGNVEVLSLSLNNISTLADFQFCRNLVELYVRRNDIRDLSEICYLMELPKLRRLLLSENPCVETAGPLYRSTVIRALPDLEMLDTTQVTPEEVEMAMKTGLLLQHPLHPVKESSPEPMYYDRGSPPSPPSMIRRNSGPSDDEPVQYIRRSPTLQAEYYYENEQMVVGKPEELTQTPRKMSLNSTPQINNNNTARRDSGISPNSSTDSQSQDSGSPPFTINSSSINTGDPPQRQLMSPENGYRERSMMEVQQRTGRRSSEYVDYDRVQFYDTEPPRRVSQPTGGNLSARSDTSRNRQRTRTSNVLSAILCLIPELDWAALEVVETQIRRRMDEFHSD